MESKLMAWITITERVQTSLPQLLFDLLFAGKLTVGGREVRIDSLVLPVVTREADHLLWSFHEPLRVSTVGPDSRINEIKQYRDKITIAIFPWCFYTVFWDDKTQT